MKRTKNMKLVVCSLLFCLLFSALGTAGQLNMNARYNTNFSEQYTLSFSEQDLSINTCLGYDMITLEDNNYLNIPGQPQIPVTEIQIALPYGMRVESVSNIQTMSKILSGEYTVFPAQPPVRTNEQRSLRIEVKPDSSIYESNALFPGTIVSLHGQTDFAGQSYAVLRLYPVQWNPQHRKLILYTEISFTLQGTDGYVYGDYLPSQMTEESYEWFEQRAQTNVINPDEVQLRTEPGATVSFGIDDPIEYVIITRSDWVDDFQPLAQWRMRSGMPSDVVSTDWIYSQYSGSSNRQKIRNYIIDMYSTFGTYYFVLGGEHSTIPFEYRTYQDESTPSDQYYSDFDDDWSHEVAVGRLSVGSTTEIARVIDKILTYEQNPPTENYAKEVLLIGMDLDPRLQAEDLKEMIADYITGYDPSYDITKVYDSHGGNHETAAKNALNAGMNLVNHADHAYNNLLGMGIENHGWELTNYEIDSQIHNYQQYSNIVSLGCHPNEIDYFQDCVGEHFVLRNDFEGGVSFTGNTRSGYGYLDEPDSLSGQLDKNWWRALFQTDNYRLGDLLIYSKHQFSNYFDINRHCEWTFNLLGDPAMPIWLDDPKTLVAASDPLEIPVGENQLVLVTVYDDLGLPLDDAWVILWKEGEYYEQTQTNSNGIAPFLVNTQTPGTMYLTVTKHYKHYTGDYNYKPYLRELDVIQSGNTAPEIPDTPSGRNPLFAEYNEGEYITATTDDDNHDLYFKWDFGDEITDWIGPYTSGEQATITHIWMVPGYYDLKVKAKDDPNGDGDVSDGEESDWSSIFEVYAAIPGDFNYDGVIDLQDLGELLGAYNKNDGGDIDDDGDTDMADLGILLSVYGHSL